MSDLNEMVRLFDEADDSAAFDGDHPILRLAIERDGLLERGKAQQSTIDSLRGEVERLREVAAAAKAMRAEMAEVDGFLHSAPCWNWAECESSKRQCAVCDFDDALAQSNDTPDAGNECAHMFVDGQQDGKRGRWCLYCQMPAPQRDTPDAEGGVAGVTACSACGGEFGDLQYHTANAGRFCSFACYNTLFGAPQQDTPD